MPGILKLKKHVYRPSDKVWIIKPEFFIRCGYPLTWKMLKNEYEFHPQLGKALRLLGLGDYEVNGSMGLSLNSRERAKLGAVLAQIATRQRNFGGKERRIYTTTNNHYLDYIAVVESKFTVRTGDYYAPGTRNKTIKIKHGYATNGGISVMPDPRGGLDNAKTHLILRTDKGWIEARNVVPAIYQQLCGSKEAAARFRETQLEQPQSQDHVYGKPDPKMNMEVI